MGDKLLKEMAIKIKEACRKNDIVSRWGGDEFVILLPNTDAEDARIICERIDINCSKVKMSDFNFSISLGYDTKKTIDDDIMQVLKSAENHMYRKKSTESSSTRGNTIATILSTLYEKNPREERHSKRVCNLCKKIGEALELSKEEISELGVIGLMHDIGKIAINNSTLNKEGKLTEEEWNDIKRHPEVGYRILSASNDMAYIAEYILKHHERVDGKGYPKGVKKKEIPLKTRILTIADAYDAMTSNRSYKKALSDELAIEELKKGAGTAFDSEIVDIVINKVLTKKLIKCKN
jgi:HD-GYP domain-containing protein (c-di-GMP phosphodiesterase class II)